MQYPTIPTTPITTMPGRPGLWVVEGAGGAFRVCTGVATAAEVTPVVAGVVDVWLGVVCAEGADVDSLVSL